MAPGESRGQSAPPLFPPHTSSPEDRETATVHRSPSRQTKLATFPDENVTFATAHEAGTLGRGPLPGRLRNAYFGHNITLLALCALLICINARVNTHGGEINLFVRLGIFLGYRRNRCTGGARESVRTASYRRGANTR